MFYHMYDISPLNLIYPVTSVLFCITSSFVTLLTNGQASGCGHPAKESGLGGSLTNSPANPPDIYDFSHKMTVLLGIH